MRRMLSIKPSSPHSTTWQQYTLQKSEEYYRIAVAVSLINRLIQETKIIFHKIYSPVSSLFCLIPSILCSSERNLAFCDIINEYKNNLPNSETAYTEVSLWKQD